MLDFNNTEIAFSAKSQSELQNAYLLFKHPWIVKCASAASNIALKIHFPLAWAVKPTLYKQFVGGETLEDCRKVIDHLRSFNVRSTLDFSAEGEQTPAGIQATFEFLQLGICILNMPRMDTAGKFFLLREHLIYANDTIDNLPTIFYRRQRTVSMDIVKMNHHYILVLGNWVISAPAPRVATEETADS